MKRVYKYRFYPTPEHVELLAHAFGCVRFVYNSVLRWRTDSYDERKEKIGICKQCPTDCADLAQ